MGCNLEPLAPESGSRRFAAVVGAEATAVAVAADNLLTAVEGYLTAVVADTPKAAAEDTLKVVAEGILKVVAVGIPLVVAGDNRRHVAAAEDNPGSHQSVVAVAAAVDSQSHLDRIHLLVPKDSVESKPEALEVCCLLSPDKAVVPSSRK